MLKKCSFIIILVLVLGLVLTACSDGTTADPVASEPDDSLSTKTGVLIEASMHVVSIQAPDGSTYTFGVNDDTDIQGSELLGNTISVSYMGEYSSGVIAVSIITITEVDHESSTGKGSTDDPGAPQPKEPSSSDETIWYMTGTVKDASMNQIQLLYEDGHTYTVLKDDNTKVDEGITVGCTARVFHKGRMVDGMVATEIHLISDSPPAAPHDDPDTIWYLTGTVTDASMNQLQLLYDDGGTTYTILKDDDTRTDPGIVVGSIVRVYHKGHLADQMLATEIRLMQKP